MADTTPVQNLNSVNLSLLLDDAVTGGDNGIAAAADGEPFTATKRNAYLHQAYRWLVQKLVESFGITRASDLLPGFVATQDVTFSASGVTLNKNYMFPLRLYKASAGGGFMLSKRSSLTDDDFSPFISNFYVIEAGKLYAYQRTSGTLAILAAGTGTLFYLKADRKDVTTGAEVASNTAPDTTVDGWAIDASVYYAAGAACLDKSIIDNDPEWASKGNRFMAMAMEKLPKTKLIP